MSELPAAALAQIERVRAELALAVIKARKTPPPNLNRPGDRLIYFEIHASIEPLVLEAVRAIVAVISSLPWTATERRQAVTMYQDQLLKEYDIPGPSFVEKLRSQAWWVTFLERLRDAERTDIPSFGQQLWAYMKDVGWFDDDLATATKQNERTVERHRKDKRLPSARTVALYDKVLTAKRGRPSPFDFTPLPRRTRRPASRRNHGPKKS